MQDSISAIIAPVPVAAVSLLLAVLLEQFFSLPEYLHPRALMRLIAERLGNKVNPQGASVFQQRLSGSLALVVWVTPWLALFYGFRYLVAEPWLLDALLLYLFIQFQPLVRDLSRIEHQLHKGQKRLARETAANWLLRDTQQLSPMGLRKAMMESASMRLLCDYLAPVFYFLLGGPLLLLGYSLIVIASQTWNCKQHAYRQFGLVSAAFRQVLDFLPGIILALLLTLYRLGSDAFKGLVFNHRDFSPIGGKLVAINSAVLQTSLGGPVAYAQMKIRRFRIERTADPENGSLFKQVKLLQLVRALLLVTILLLMAAALIVKQNPALTF